MKFKSLLGGDVIKHMDDVISACADRIEDMERAGANALRSQLLLLPVQGTMVDHLHPEQAPRDDVARAWQQMGIRFAPIADEEVSDDLFCQATIPAGWQIVPSPTNPHYWSDLIDDRGCIRASMLYKAAFYDRRAHINVQARFDVKYETLATCRWPNNVEPPYEGIKDSIVVACAFDHLHKREAFVTANFQHSALVAENRLKRTAGDLVGRNMSLGYFVTKIVEDWLNEHYPKWHDVDAYWEQS